MRRAFYAVLVAAAIAFGPSLAREVWAQCTAILATDVTKVSKGGDIMTGPLTMNGASSWVIAGSSLTTSGGLFGNGAGITSISAANITAGTLPNARLDSTSVTLQGNTFNGTSQLVQLNASALVPNANLDSSSVTLLGAAIDQASEIANNTIIGPGNVFLTRGGIYIGNNVNLSGFGFFISQEHDLDAADFTETTLAPVRIDDHVWIATNVTILPGVAIGEGSVVGAGSVVTKDVPPYTVVAGNPARVIKERPREISYLLRSTKGLKWL